MDDEEILEFTYKRPKKRDGNAYGYEFGRHIRYRPYMLKCAVRFEEISDVLEENVQTRLVTQCHNWGDEYSI